MLCLFSEISFFPLEILVGGCGAFGGILQGNYALIESFRLLYPGERKIFQKISITSDITHWLIIKFITNR